MVSDRALKFQMGILLHETVDTEIDDLKTMDLN
jgi:hypothetical protein